MAGEIDIVSGMVFVQNVRAGRLKVIAIGGADRSPELPNVPTLNELGLGKDIFGPNFFGFVAPAGTPPAIVEKLKDAMKKVAMLPEVIARLEKLDMRTKYVEPAVVDAEVKRLTAVYMPILKKLDLNK